jgi:hypothetical protein
MLELGVSKELGMTLAQLRNSCSKDELLIWSAYFGVINEDQQKQFEDAKKANRGRMR